MEIPLRLHVKGQLPGALVPFSSSSSTPSVARTPANSPASSSWSLPPVYPISKDCLSVMQCLRKLSSVPRCRNELAQIDFDAIEYHKVKFLPTKFDGNVVFELPPCRGNANSIYGGNGQAVWRSYMVPHSNVKHPQQSRIKVQKVELRRAFDLWKCGLWLPCEDLEEERNGMVRDHYLAF